MSFAKGNILYRHQGDEAGRLGRLSEEIYPDANWFFSEGAVFFSSCRAFRLSVPFHFLLGCRSTRGRHRPRHAHLMEWNKRAF